MTKYSASFKFKDVWHIMSLRKRLLLYVKVCLRVANALRKSVKTIIGASKFCFIFFFTASSTIKIAHSSVLKISLFLFKKKLISFYLITFLSFYITVALVLLVSNFN